ncbi:hypothetical protein [Nostoc sp.]|uniref:hypothetical protein n=1 Tax=Nostoc sp. TaxID=1180 RepID=UPI002FFBC2C8
MNRKSIQEKLSETKSNNSFAASSNTIQGSWISFDENGDRRENPNHPIVKVNQKKNDNKDKEFEFYPITNVDCPT